MSPLAPQNEDSLLFCLFRINTLRLFIKNIMMLLAESGPMPRADISRVYYFDTRDETRYLRARCA